MPKGESDMRVGRIVRVLTDSTRKESLSQSNNDRMILVSIFYQVDEEWNPEHEAYYKDLYAPRQEEFIKRFSDDNEEKRKYLNNIKINTFNNAPMTKEDRKFPVVLFSAGLGMLRDFYMFNIEELVTKGYIVVAIEHVYDSEFTVLPDGGIIEQAEIFKDLTLEMKEEVINIRKKDTLFVLDQLTSLNAEDKIIKNKMDLDKIGAIGHSIGAYSLFESFNEDERIKVLVMLDGAIQYINLSKKISEEKKLNKHLLNFRKELNEYEERMKFFIEKNENKLDGETFKKLIVSQHHTVIKQEKGQEQLDQYLEENYQSFIKLSKTEHLTFSDYFIINPELQDDKMLPIEEAHSIINNIIVAFLNEHLCKMNKDYTNIINDNKYGELLKR
jgi:hypothetical protein